MFAQKASSWDKSEMDVLRGSRKAHSRAAQTMDNNCNTWWNRNGEWFPLLIQDRPNQSLVIHCIIHFRAHPPFGRNFDKIITQNWSGSAFLISFSLRHRRSEPLFLLSWDCRQHSRVYFSGSQRQQGQSKRQTAPSSTALSSLLIFMEILENEIH